MQVNFLLALMAYAPSLVQLAPALTTAALLAIGVRDTINVKLNITSRFMLSPYGFKAMSGKKWY
jgi:hypothetical protein